MVRGTEQQRASHIQEMREAIKAKGWEEVALIEEYEGSESALERALNLVNGKLINKLFVYDITRIGRRSSHVHCLIDLLCDAKVSLCWQSQDLEMLLDNGMRDPAGSMMLSLSVAIEIEREKLMDQSHWCDSMDVVRKGCEVVFLPKKKPKPSRK